MSNYVVVTNMPNRIATAHSADCAHLQSYPPDYASANSERRSFDDGVAALSHAQQSMPSNYGSAAIVSARQQK
jgi:hypothetical protein